MSISFGASRYSEIPPISSSTIRQISRQGTRRGSCAGFADSAIAVRV